MTYQAKQYDLCAIYILSNMQKKHINAKTHTEMHKQIHALKKRCRKNEHTLNFEVNCPLTMWHSPNEIIPVFIWVTSNYTAGNKPLWPHILALTPHPQKMCTSPHTDETTHPHMPITNTKWMGAQCSFPQVFTTTRALYCIRTWL